ncbi:hypothetical protein EDD16DRAFT_557847 [Pisolithus croceorrhizus]|nr:hypothetical protein EDD16DRAFT_557847 [Pisolithus croceorrhizus]KAI6105321.1 hypothetical protein EV401DRAFT_2213913 [Pisolithus croceorrhizus]KAI6134572.1 hypothetical protein EDD17DRAFT_534212 [Pisolithus thermaeus]
MAHSQPKPIDTKQWLKEDRDVTIYKFIATAVKMRDEFKPDDPTKQLIHWRGGGAYPRGRKWFSTSFDTRKLSKVDPFIEVQFISKPFMVSSAAPYYWECPLSKKYTTTEVYELVVAKKLHHYMYNGGGSGCLTWTTKLVDVLETEGVLPAGSKANFLKKVEEVRADPKYWVPEEPGTRFY